MEALHTNGPVVASSGERAFVALTSVPACVGAHQTHTTIRCSASDELYPGTTSRKVTLVSSSAAALDAAQSLVLLAVAQGYPDTFREVGVVVPEALAGRIIGKVGSRISRLREGCQRCDMTARQEGSAERMLIISGDVVQITRTVRQVRTRPATNILLIITHVIWSF